MESALLSHHLWYAGAWTVVLVLYGLDLSVFNQPMTAGLTTFLVTTIVVSLVFAVLERRRNESSVPAAALVRSVDRLAWVRRALLTVIVVLTVAEWAYLGRIPMLSGAYSGFDPTASVQAGVGIPYLHVGVMALTVFYAIYLAYLWSVSGKTAPRVHFVICVGLLILGQNRGFAIFALFMLAVFVARGRARRAGRAGSSVRFVGYLLLGLLGVAVVLGVLGNLRLGEPWNDFTRFKAIAGYEHTGSSPLDWLSWSYTYMTSPVANLALMTQHTPPDASLGQVLANFVPATFAPRSEPTALSRMFVVDHLNASTGFADFYAAGGQLGLYVSFAVMLLYFAFWEGLVRRMGHLVDLMRGLSVLFVVTNVFYNPFSNVALAYAPLLVVIAAALHRRAARAPAGRDRRNPGRA